MPDLDKVITMSEYFDVTTDYILRGSEPTANKDVKSSEFASKILYLASTAFIAIGLFCAFGGWYEEQTADSIWGSMIIQAVGVVGYFIGRLLSTAKAPFVVNWLNIVIVAFMPISLIVAICLNRLISPYPTDIISSCVFAVVYIIMAGLTYVVLKRRTK